MYKEDNKDKLHIFLSRLIYKNKKELLDGALATSIKLDV